MPPNQCLRSWKSRGIQDLPHHRESLLIRPYFFQHISWLRAIEKEVPASPPKARGSARVREYPAGNLTTGGSRTAFLRSLCNLPKFRAIVDLIPATVRLPFSIYNRSSFYNLWNDSQNLLPFLRNTHLGLPGVAERSIYQQTSTPPSLSTSGYPW